MQTACRNEFSLETDGERFLSVPPKYKPHVLPKTARAMALKSVPGRITTEELEREKGHWIYSFEIKPKDESRPIVKEVNIDADSGKIVAVVTEPEGSPNRDNSPLSEWIAYVFAITVLLVTERILVVFVREAKAL